MTMVSISLLTVASLLFYVFLSLNSFPLSITQFLMLILGMGSPLVSCRTTVQVCWFFSMLMFDSYYPEIIPFSSTLKLRL